MTFEKASGPSASERAVDGRGTTDRHGADDDSEEEIGPALPGQERTRDGRMGPSIPDMQDLELKRGKDFIPDCYLYFSTRTDNSPRNGTRRHPRSSTRPSF